MFLIREYTAIFDFSFSNNDLAKGLDRIHVRETTDAPNVSGSIRREVSGRIGINFGDGASLSYRRVFHRALLDLQRHTTKRHTHVRIRA